jgi:hypothetical protein
MLKRNEKMLELETFMDCLRRAKPRARKCGMIGRQPRDDGESAGIAVAAGAVTSCTGCPLLREAQRWMNFGVAAAPTAVECVSLQGGALMSPNRVNSTRAIRLRGGHRALPWR